MPKWKLSNRSKRKEDISTEVEMTIQRTEKSEEKPKIPEIREESDVPIKVYDEMLYSKGFIQKNPALMPSERTQSLKRSRWESLGTIERKVDEIDCKNTEVTGNGIQTSDDINQKVDYVFSKKNIW